MFRLLFLLFITNFCALPAIAQHTEVDAIRNQVWPNNDPYQDITEVPAKWHDASAVILYQSYTRTYSKKGKTIRNANSLRKRIKIQDNSALQSFSEFAFDGLNSSTNSFRKKSEFTVSEIKVIKANFVGNFLPGN